MSSPPYVPLQVLGHHSLLRGTFSPKALVARCVRLGLDAVALTDRNAVMGVVPFVRAAREAGVRPLIGVDLEKEGERLTVLARGRAGYAACCELVTARHLEPGFRLLEAVAARRDRLVVLCADPELLPRAAAALAGGRLHGAVVRLRGHRPERLRRVARALGVPLVAAGDVHFLDPGDHVVHRVLRAVGRNTLVDRLRTEDLAPEEAVLLGPAAMRARHAGEDELLQATRAVAEECHFELELDRPRLPAYDLPDGRTAEAWLRELAHEGARRRYGDPLPERVRERLESELGVIGALGFPGYFLVVREIVEFARSRDIPFVGRGSAADSLVVYCLGFTRVDPFEHELVFERFLSPSRRHLPDIDLDFCWRRRDEVIAHVYRRHGRDRVATICTHTTFRFRSAFREVAKALALPASAIDRVSKGLPYDYRAGLAQAALDFPECRGVEGEAGIRRALRLADRLRGLPRHLGMHPGGMVIADRPITDYTPLVRSAKGPLITQQEMRGIEALGLVKMDLLGQRSLSTIGDTLESLRTVEGRTVDLGAIPEDDPGVRELLRRGATLGCFQVESPGMRKLLVEMRADDRRSVIDSVALIRPGPASSGMKEHYVRRRRGLEPAEPPHPRLAGVLERTLGIMLYQEDILRVTAAMTGWPLEVGDLVRAALGKKKDPELLGDLRRRYLEQATERGIPGDEALEVWSRIGDFAAFSYCKAHAATYGQLAYEELYLKSRHPAAFFCAVLNNDRGYYPDRVYLEEARRRGVRFLLPCINRSGRGFAPERGAIRIGLGRIRSLSRRSLERLLREREARGPLLSLVDLLDRVRPDVREARHLIMCGALDVFGRPRPELLWQLDLVRKRPSGGGGTPDLFGAPEPAGPTLPRLADYPEPRKRRMEYLLLGLTAEGGAAVFGRADPSVPTVEAAALPEHVGRMVTCFGWCSATRRARTAEGRYMRFITLEDPTGTIEGVFFPEAYRRLGHHVRGEGPYLLRGRVEADYGAVTVHVTDFRPAAESTDADLREPRGGSARPLDRAFRTEAEPDPHDPASG